MRTYLKTDELEEMLLHVCDAIIDSEPYLTEIDNQSGDGDHGIGMKRGFSSLRAMLEKNRFQTVNELFRCSGMELIKTMGGASGVLFGTLLTGGLLGMPPMESIDLTGFANMMLRATQAIMRRGRAKPGDKTMVDALLPAVNALALSAKAAEDFPTALRKAAACAEEGKQATAGMVARIGRARQYGEKSIGCCDAGAASVSIMYLSMAQWAKNTLA